MRWGGWTDSWKARRGRQSQAKDSKAEAFGLGLRDLPVSFAEVAKNYITMLEIGTRENCSLPVLRRIAKALGVPAGELLK